MLKILKTLKTLQAVLTTAGAVLAAAIVAVETYQQLKKKIRSSEGPRLDRG